MTVLPRVGAKIRVTGAKDDATFTMTDWIKSWLEVHDELSFVFENGFAFNSKMWPGWEVSFEELEPPKPALPPQPAVGGLVMVTDAVRGASLVYRRSDAAKVDGYDYELLDGATPGYAAWRTWEYVCSLGTPVLLVPAPDLAELVKALAEDSFSVHDADDHLATSKYCQVPRCVERRALLARYETGAAA